MISDGFADPPWLGDLTSPILVGEPENATPFMTGILVSSLVRRGLPFATAYRTARTLEQRLRERDVHRVMPAEIASEVLDILDDESRDRLDRDPSATHADNTDNTHNTDNTDNTDNTHHAAGKKTVHVERSVERRIMVVGPGGSVPFSTGVLAQSLLATALDPREAYEIAQRIERVMAIERLHEIDRSALRALAHAELKRSAGPEAAERYLSWRRYEEPDKPVIILLGGTSGVGKTTLALEVARRMGVGRVLSTDSIRQVMRLMISRDLMPWIHASSYDAHFLVTRADDRAADVLDGFRAQANSVAVGVHASLDRSVEESANLVVDGVSLLPGVIDLKRYAGRAVVAFCVVATLDESALRKRFEVRASGQPSRLAHRYLQNFEGILTIQRHLIAEARRRDMLVIDNSDLDRSTQAIIGHVLDKLRQEGSSSENP